MKMLSPKKSPRVVFCRQMKLKIANGDIGEAQRDPWHIVRSWRSCLLKIFSSETAWPNELKHGRN
jgi:hypothetical protein